MTTYFLGMYVMARRDDVEERDGGGWLVGWSSSDAGLISPWSWWMMVGWLVDVSSVVSSSSSLPCSSGPLLPWFYQFNQDFPYIFFIGFRPF